MEVSGHWDVEEGIAVFSECLPVGMPSRKRGIDWLGIKVESTWSPVMPATSARRKKTAILKVIESQK